jgi:putative ABC transport system permease protein
VNRTESAERRAAGKRPGSPSFTFHLLPSAFTRLTAYCSLLTAHCFSDLRIGLRTLLKTPGFTALTVTTLALGIGANTAIFSVLEAVLLRPLPYPEPAQLVVLQERTPRFAGGAASYPNYLDWRAEQRSFTDLALYRNGSFNLSGGGETAQPERLKGQRVTANFLTVLGIMPQLGRNFTEAEDQPGGLAAVLISDRLWLTWFGRDPGAVGKRIVVDTVPREVIGVLPAAFTFKGDLLLPLAELRNDPDINARGNHPGFFGLGRLKSGVTLSQARSDLDGIAVNLAKRYPETNTDRRVQSDLLLENLVGSYRASLQLLAGGVGCVLLIGCANVANLLLGRSARRERELAVRAALGASRQRLFRQLLSESVILGILGGALGAILAFWGRDLIVGLIPKDVPRFRDAQIDLLVLGFTLSVSVGAGLLAGIWPALQVARIDALSLALRDGNARGSSDGGRQQQIRSALVIGQVALALMLLTITGLLLKHLWHLQQWPIGFNPRGLLMMSISLPEARYREEAQAGQFYRQLLERVRHLPGVVNAAIGRNVPFDGESWSSNFHVTGTPPDPPGSEPFAEMTFVSADYFNALEVPILCGRGFGPEDASARRWSAIVDQALANRYFPGVDPIGKQIDDCKAIGQNPPLTVVGVVRRTRNQAPGEGYGKGDLPQIYLPSGEEALLEQTLIIRVGMTDPVLLTEPVKREVLKLDPDQPVSDVATMESNIGESLATRRLTATMLAVFAGVAVLLAAVGLYGVMALSVAQRTRELGIRLALGAQRAALLRLVIGEGMRLVAIGAAIGLAGTFVAVRLLPEMSGPSEISDAATYLVVLGLLGVVALMANAIPALRATRLNPVEALRQE